MHRHSPRFLAAFMPPRRLLVLTAALALLATLAHVQSGATEAAQVVNRQSCEAIVGTRYKSSVERIWYLAYCMAPPPPPAPATPTPTPTPAPAVTSGGGSVLDQFAAGYRWAGGPEYHLAHILHNVIPCESTSNPYAVNYGGPYYGLMQFSPATWYAAGGGDWFNPWQQGANTARLLRWASPQTQWPHCWYA